MGQVVSCCVYGKCPKNMQRINGNIQYMFVRKADQISMDSLFKYIIVTCSLNTYVRNVPSGILQVLEL